jgi:hypothetical protein
MFHVKHIACFFPTRLHCQTFEKKYLSCLQQLWPGTGWRPTKKDCSYKRNCRIVVMFHTSLIKGDRPIYGYRNDHELEPRKTGQAPVVDCRILHREQKGKALPGLVFHGD